MASEPRRLIVNADDFGRSSAINQAIIESHRRGILTSASLMVNGVAVDEAVRLAHKHPTLAVGLHLTLTNGKSTLSPREIPGLVDPFGNFSNSPVSSGIRYWFKSSLRRQLESEIAAQIEKFAAFDLPLDHLNGHLNIHLHPRILEILIDRRGEWHVERIRLTREPRNIDAEIGTNSLWYRKSHSLIFSTLSRRAEAILRHNFVRHTDHVFGLLQNDRVDVAYLREFLPRLPVGLSELYCHPSTDSHKHEFEALASPAIAEIVEGQNIQLTTYREALSSGATSSAKPSTSEPTRNPLPTHGKANRKSRLRRRKPKTGPQSPRRPRSARPR
ncbi:MAG: hopanoid biosynthesis-associated protein HpnK [Limisphaerales bacterium]